MHARLSVCLSVWLAGWLSVCLSVCMYVYIVCISLYIYIYSVCVCVCVCLRMWFYMYIMCILHMNIRPARKWYVELISENHWKTCPCPCLFRDVFKKWAIHAGNSVNLAVARSVSFHSQQFLAVCAQESPSKHPSIQGMLSLLAFKFWGTQRFIFLKMLSIVPIRSGEKL